MKRKKREGEELKVGDKNKNIRLLSFFPSFPSQNVCFTELVRKNCENSSFFSSHINIKRETLFSVE